MYPERHPRGLGYPRILLLVILVSSFPAKINSANNNSLKSGTTLNLNSTVSQAPKVKTPLKFHGIYKHQPISKVLYDISTFFDFNSLILDLEDRTISHQFVNCNLQQCLEEVHNTGRVRMQYGTNFAVFSRSESSISAFGDKISRMQKRLFNRNHSHFKMSFYDGNLFLVLDRLIKKSKLPLQLSNQIDSEISLHLKSVVPFEVLFYIMQYYKLKIVHNNELKTIVPQYK